MIVNSSSRLKFFTLEIRLCNGSDMKVTTS